MRGRMLSGVEGVENDVYGFKEAINLRIFFLWWVGRGAGECFLFCPSHKNCHTISSPSASFLPSFSSLHQTNTHTHTHTHIHTHTPIPWQMMASFVWRVFIADLDLIKLLPLRLLLLVLLPLLLLLTPLPTAAAAATCKPFQLVDVNSSFISHGNESQSPANLDCLWLIVAPENFVVSLKVLTLNIPCCSVCCTGFCCTGGCCDTSAQCACPCSAGTTNINYGSLVLCAVPTLANGCNSNGSSYSSTSRSLWVRLQTKAASSFAASVTFKPGPGELWMRVCVCFCF